MSFRHNRILYACSLKCFFGVHKNYAHSKTWAFKDLSLFTESMTALVTYHLAGLRIIIAWLVFTIKFPLKQTAALSVSLKIKLCVCSMHLKLSPRKKFSNQHHLVHNSLRGCKKYYMNESDGHKE